MNKKLSKTKEIALVVILILIAINLTVSYSYFSVNTTHDNTLSTISGHVNCLDITYEEQNSLNLSGQYPVSDEWALANMTPVTITVENNCENTDERINYTLALTTLKNATGYINDNQVRMHLKRTLDGDTEKIFKNTDYVSSLTQVAAGNALDFINQDLQTRGLTSSYTTRTNYILDSTDIGAGETNTYRLYLWIDYYEGDTTHAGLNDNSTQNKQYKTTLELVLNADDNVEAGYMGAFDTLAGLCESESTIVPYTGKVTDDVSQIGAGVDATKVCAFTSNNNNNLVFANSCWQIRRTTETGGVKIQYNGEPTLGTDGSGNTTYDCGTNRPYHMGTIKTKLNLSGTYLYGDGYTTSVSGDTTTFTLTNTQSVQVTSSNGSAVIPTLAGKYTCKNATGICTNSSLYRIDSYDVGYTAYVYKSTFRDDIGTSLFNTQQSITNVGYKYNNIYEGGSLSISQTVTVDSSSTYALSYDIKDNGDGTFELTGSVLEKSGSDWSTPISTRYKYVCMPGYWAESNGVYTCSDNSEQFVGALKTLNSTTNTGFKAYSIYKYGYGIAANGNNYQIVAKNGNSQTLQYIRYWGNNLTTNCFTDEVTKLSTCGYRSINNSHYTCYNLTGVCSTYYYIYYTVYGGHTSYVAISDGKYVSTDLTDTNNILYEMLVKNNINSSNSIIKEVIDLWYQSNILNTNYESLIDINTVFCNDRRITDFGVWNPEGGNTYNNTPLTFAEYVSSNNLNCSRILDSFSVSNNSAKLLYPIGLTSNPEMNILDNNVVRSSANFYWTMSPNSFEQDGSCGGTGAYGRYVDKTGNLYSMGLANNVGGSVRPAIVLNSNAEFSSGTGSTSDPFIVKGSEMTP